MTVGAETKQTGQREEIYNSPAANLAKCNFDTVVLLPVYSAVLVACEAEGSELPSTRLVTVNIKVMKQTTKHMVTVLKIHKFIHIIV